MGGGGFKLRRLAATHEVWSTLERMRWSVYRNVVVKSEWIMKHFSGVGSMRISKQLDLRRCYAKSIYKDH